MELYFKDFEDDADVAEMSLDRLDHDSTESDECADDELAFAELEERVSAARLVY